jgi:hypothetical protein
MLKDNYYVKKQELLDFTKKIELNHNLIQSTQKSNLN